MQIANKKQRPRSGARPAASQHLGDSAGGRPNDPACLCTMPGLSAPAGFKHTSGPRIPIPSSPNLPPAFLSLTLQHVQDKATKLATSPESGKGGKGRTDAGEESRKRAAANAVSFVSLRYRRTTQNAHNIRSTRTDLQRLPVASTTKPINSSLQPKIHSSTNHSTAAPTRSSRTRARFETFTSIESTPSTPSLIPDDSGSDTEMDSRNGIKIADGGVGKDISDTIWQLHDFQSLIHGYRPDHERPLQNQLSKVGQSLAAIHEKASDPRNPLQNVRIAPEVIDYVEDGRNPDIFTRDFVDLVLRGNAVMNGKQQAFRNFSQIYAKALKEGFDGMDGEIDMIMSNAGMKQDKSTGEYVEKQQNGTTPHENTNGIKH